MCTTLPFMSCDLNSSSFFSSFPPFISVRVSKGLGFLHTYVHACPDWVSDSLRPSPIAQHDPDMLRVDNHSLTAKRPLAPVSLAVGASAGVDKTSPSTFDPVQFITNFRYQSLWPHRWVICRSTAFRHNTTPSSHPRRLHTTDRARQVPLRKVHVKGMPPYSSPPPPTAHVFWPTLVHATL